jgi:hypothetical protein
MRRALPSPTESVATGAAVITSYAAMVLAQKYSVPLEVAATGVGVAVSIGRRLIRWISDRMPEPKKK